MAAERLKVEFYCQECKKYFDFKLNMLLNGNIRIHCPNCDHVHFRQIKDGLITETRFDRNDQSPIIEDLRPMKASCRDIQIQTVVTAGKERRPLHELWHELFSANV
jgi:DNA-directed RNA polymerase subunit RPC12/RpoP